MTEALASRIKRDVFLDYPHKGGSVRILQLRVADMRHISLDEQLQGLYGLPDLIGDEPTGLIYLYSIWAQLSQTKAADARITFPDLLAYSEVNRIRLEPWESMVILKLDSAFAHQYNIERGKES